jgi:hypothetical protein
MVSSDYRPSPAPQTKHRPVTIRVLCDPWSATLRQDHTQLTWAVREGTDMNAPSVAVSSEDTAQTRADHGRAENLGWWPR